MWQLLGNGVGWIRVTFWQVGGREWTRSQQKGLMNLEA